MAATLHACPGQCGQRVPRHKFACVHCWHRLPSRMRWAISYNYRRDRGAHMDSMRAAMSWYDEHPTET
jgi:hypothetical protein